MQEERDGGPDWELKNIERDTSERERMKGRGGVGGIGREEGN